MQKAVSFMKTTEETNLPRQQAISQFEHSESFFLTGKAGTGKTTLIRELAARPERKVLIFAPTGIAAVNAGGMTIHSFFQLPPRPLLPQRDKDVKILSEDKQAILQKADCLVLDEISMVRADVLDAVDLSLRRNLKSRKPFGGKPVIFTGDPLQLEPVAGNREEETNMLEMWYPQARPPFFFDSFAWREAMPEKIELVKIYRQKDPFFTQLLNKVRIGRFNQADLDALNQRYSPHAQQEDFSIELCTTNAIADQKNQEKLQQLKGSLYQLKGALTGNFDSKRLPTEEVLQLKENAQVIFIKNDPEGRWVNGTIAKVRGISSSSVVVEMENGSAEEVLPVTWENVVYRYDREKDEVVSEVVGTFTQFPLRLAWAITIHKSQGMTFERMQINFGRSGAFACGQTYVALSRCTSLEGLTLRSKIRPEDIRVHERVLAFMEYGHGGNQRSLYR